jgi:hypothetical protein
MLNPSKADAEADDPTIRRCLRFARDLGFGSIDVTNLFAWRATDPGELARASDAVGPENDRHILEAAGAAGMVVCAWGAFPAARPRAGAVVRLLRSASVKLHVLGWTTTPGVPRHPLFLPASARPIGAFFYDLLPPGEEGHLCADP